MGSIMDFVMFLHEHTFYLICVAFVFWSSLYFFCKSVISKLGVSKDYPLLTRTYIAEAFISGTFGLVCGSIGIRGVYNCYHDVMNAEDQVVVFYCTFGTGYFLYDIIAMFYSNYLFQKKCHRSTSTLDLVCTYFKAHALMLGHHIILISILFPALITYSSMGHFFASCFFCMEISSPSVNVRLILSKLDMKQSKFYLVNGVVMMVVFALCRVIVFPYMYWAYINEVTLNSSVSIYAAFCKIPLLCHMSCVLILAPQVYWLSLMIRGLAAVLTKRPKLLDKLD